MVTLSPVELIDFPGCPTAVVRHEALPADQVGPFMDAAFTALGEAIGRGLLTPSGPAFSRYETPPSTTLDLEAGFPTTAPLTEPVTLGDVTIEPSELPACRLATAKYTGPYDGLGEAWGRFVAELRGAGHELGLPFWEAYDTEPTPDTDHTTLVTGLAIPVTDAPNP